MIGIFDLLPKAKAILNSLTKHPADKKEKKK